jgi:hypothetical protein
MGKLNCRCGFQWHQETWWGPSEWVTFTQHDDIEISDMANLAGFPHHSGNAQPMDSTPLKILSVALDQQKTIFLEENDQCLKRPTSYPLIFTLEFTLRQEGLIYIWKSSTSRR